MITALKFLPEFLKSAKSVVISDPLGDAKRLLNTSLIKGAPTSDAVKLDPHQIEPYLAMFDENVRQVTNMACPQIGKSWPWQVAAAVKMYHGNYRGWILYQNEKIMEEVNEQIIKKLFMSNPKLKRQMEKPHAIGVDKMNLEDSLLLYSSLITEPASHFVHELYLSEVDRTQQSNEARWNNYGACFPRVARFNESKQSKIVIESSPSTDDNVTATSFKQGSQGFWHLQCMDCGGFNVAHRIVGEYKSGKFWGGLQWHKDDSGEIVPDSIRYHCFDCNFAHEQNEHWKAMNIHGEYIHKHPEREEHKSFQAGGLAGSGALSGSSSKTWLGIAKAYRKCQHQNTYSARLTFDNHERGLPLQKRSTKEGDKLTQEILKHRPAKPLQAEDISLIYLIADTQQKNWVTTVWAVDKYKNKWCLSGFSCATQEDMKKAWNEKYYGIRAEYFMIDFGGHRKKEVLQLLKILGSGALGYHGNSRSTLYEKQIDDEDEVLYPDGKKWAWSEGDEEERTVLADPNYYRCNLLYDLYEKTNPETDQEFIFIPAEWQEDSWQIEQITACKPPKGYEKHRVDYSKWNSGVHDHRTDDVFDCFKMALTLFDIAKKEDYWIHQMNFYGEE